MLLKVSKKIFNKVCCLAMKSLPVILPVLLVIHTNATASVINGQPVPPNSIRKYRKF